MKTKANRISRMVPVIAAGLLLGSSLLPANAGPQIWSDEFNGAIGSKPSSSNWTYETGGGGWGNNELQIYTTDVANARITSDSGATDDKCLFIKATTSTGAWNGQWYSARLNSKRLMGPGQSTGFRVRCPKGGAGYWPACWMLGNQAGGWPACGEIDIMEQINGQNTIHQSLHMPGWDPTVSNNVADSSDWFEASGGLAPDCSYIKFWINGSGTAVFTAASRPAGSTWAFNSSNRYYVLLNVAMGGNWPGSPNSSTVVGKGMSVDWVRQYTYP